MPSAPTVYEEKETRKQPYRIGRLAGLDIRKWIFNEPDATADVAVGDRASDIDLERTELPTPRPWVSCGLPETTNFPLDTRCS